MQQAGYHHANMLALQMHADLNNQQVELLAMVQDLVEPAPVQDIVGQAAPEQDAMNATIADTVQLQILKILQDMQNTQIGGNTRRGNGGGTSGSRSSGSGNGGGNQRQSINRRTPDNATFNRADTTKYCHTHGACNHSSAECNRKAAGHKNTATQANRMGGSNAFCQGAADE